MIGLLQGLDDVPELDWGSPRTQVEEEVVIILADLLQGNGTMDGHEENVDLFCSAIQHINDERLRVLDLEVSSRKAAPLILKDALIAIESKLLQQFEDQDGLSSAEACSTLSKALGRLFTVFSYGDARAQTCASAAMIRFCGRIRALASRKFPATSTQAQIFSAFLPVANSILSILLERMSAQGTLAELTVDILLTLASFADIADESQHDHEEYERILLGTIDALVFHGGPRGVRMLYDRRKEGFNSIDASAGFALVLGEQILHYLDGEAVKHYLDLCQRSVISL